MGKKKPPKDNCIIIAYQGGQTPLNVFLWFLRSNTLRSKVIILQCNYLFKCLYSPLEQKFQEVRNCVFLTYSYMTTLSTEQVLTIHSINKDPHGQSVHSVTITFIVCKIQTPVTFISTLLHSPAMETLQTLSFFTDLHQKSSTPIFYTDLNSLCFKQYLILPPSPSVHILLTS